MPQAEYLAVLKKGNQELAVQSLYLEQDNLLIIEDARATDKAAISLTYQPSETQQPITWSSYLFNASKSLATEVSVDQNSLEFEFTREPNPYRMNQSVGIYSLTQASQTTLSNAYANQHRAAPEFVRVEVSRFW